MKTVAKKTDKKALIIFDLVVGILVGIFGGIVVPVLIFCLDPEFLTNIYIWITAIGLLLFFGLITYATAIRPLMLFKKSKEIQAETDGEYIYFYGNKEAKIPLKEMEGTSIDIQVPYLLSHEFIIHLVSEQYGKLIINVPNYGKYKLYYIANAKDVMYEIKNLIETKLN